MNHPDVLQNWLWLWRIPGIGPRTLQKLLDVFITIDEILAAPDEKLLAAGMTRRSLKAFKNSGEDLAQPDLDWLGQHTFHHILLKDDLRYPQQLKNVADAPPVLFVYGNVNCLSDPQIAIVGSRNPTQSGKDTAYQFSHHLGTSGFTVSSGLALGIDKQAHHGALDANAPTIAVTATGLDSVYPARHRDLAHAIADNGGALVSEFPIGTQPKASHFPRRNRIISGLSLGTLVVEAAVKSGSLITAQHALEQGKEVFAIPGSIHNPLARGCHHLIRQGAKLVETAEHILEEIAETLDFQLKQNDISSNEEDIPIADLDKDYENVLMAMEYEAMSVDQLVIQTGLTPEAVSSILLMLELQGYVASGGGGSYTRIKS